MSFDRTERQRKADAALDEAIREMAAAEAEQRGGEDPGLIVHWMTITSVVGHDSDGGTSGVEVFHQNGSIPWPQAFGMLHAARLGMERDYLDADDA